MSTARTTMKTRFLSDAWEAPDLNVVAAALRAAGRCRVALDTETYDPDLKAKGPGARRDGFLLGVSLKIENGPGWYLPVRHSTDNLDPKRVLQLLGHWGRNFEGALVGAHLLYDLEYLALDKATPVVFPKARLLDVQCAEPLLDENKPTYALDSLGWEHLGRGKRDLKRLGELAVAAAPGARERDLWQREPQRAFRWLRGRDVAEYALGDVEDPLEILRAQEAKLKAQGLETAFELETRLLPCVLAMRLQGVRVDVAGAKRARADLVKRRTAVLDELKAAAGYSVGLWDDSVAPALEAVGVRLPRTPKTNRPSLTKGWLERCPHPLAQLFLKGRRYDKTIGTFLDGHVLGSAVGGRVYPSIHSFKNEDNGTVSGRFAYSLPNLQQLSARDEELAPIVRGCFVPEPGALWERYDYSQIEYRFLAHYARGPGADRARAAYSDDPKTSFHKLVAAMMGVDPNHGPTYKKVKNTNFCKVYGGGYRKVAETAGIPEEDAKAFVERYDSELPFVKETNRWVDRVAQQRGYVRSISGRRHRFEKWEAADWDLSKEWGPLGSREYALDCVKREIEACRQEGKALPRAGVRRAHTYRALNRLLQGGAADAMKEGMVKIWESGICAELGVPLVTVHDELGFSRPPGKAATAAADEAQRLLEHAVELRVPVLVERQRGKSWGACK